MKQLSTSRGKAEGYEKGHGIWQNMEAKGWRTRLCNLTGIYFILIVLSYLFAT